MRILSLLRSFKVLAFVLVALGILVAAEMSQAVAESFLVDDEAQMVSLVNSHRSQHGLGGLQVNDALRMVARRQAQRMVVAGYIYHNPDLAKEANDAVPGWLLLGENVGVGPDTPSVEQAFLDSPRHHENIDAGQFNIVGVGAMASQEGMRYYTQNFAQIKGSGAAAAPRPAAPVRPPAPVVRVPAKPAAARPAVKAAAPARPQPTVAPTPAPTPVPTHAPTVAPVQQPVQRASVNIGTGLGGMLKRFFAKLVFWD